MRFEFLILFSICGTTAFASADYKTLTDSCKSCNSIDKLVNKYNEETSPSNRLALALKVAGTIKEIKLKGKDKEDQYREIYFATKGSIEVLPDDFDSETCVRLLDLRTQAPETFDYVFTSFPLEDQKRIIERMKSFKDDKLRPNAKLPVAKEPKQ